MKTYSFSQFQRYNTCRRSYKLYYIDKYRETTVTSFLAFGKAIDNTLNGVLSHYRDNNCSSYNYNHIQEFDRQWETFTNNGVTVKLIDSTVIGYAEKDFTIELITEEDKGIFYQYVAKHTPHYSKTSFGMLVNLLESDKASNDETKKQSATALINVLFWLILRHKAHLMLDAYVRVVLPQIIAIKAIQQEITLDATNGDRLIGYIDAIVKFRGDSDWTILDNKTSGSYYEHNDVKRSKQLAVYAYSTGVKYVAFAVMLKLIKLNKIKICTLCGSRNDGKHKTCDNILDNGKRCNGEFDVSIDPQGQIQLFKDAIHETDQEIVINNYSDMIDSIDRGDFTQNLEVCHNYYGQRCPYYNVCWKNSTKGLVKK